MSDSEYSETLDVNGQDESEGNAIHLQLLQQQQLQQQQYQQQQQQHHNQQNVSYMTYAGSTSSSSGESSISTTSSDESDAEDSEDTLELAKITTEVLNLPRGLCENAAIFQEFFSLSTWQELPLPVQQHLQQFLPRFQQLLPPQMAAVEQSRTISMLFNNELTRFGASPLTSLQQQLEVGNCRPDIIKLRQNILKSRRREQRFQHCERLSHTAKHLFISRQRLLDTAYKSSPDSFIKPAAFKGSLTQNKQQPKPSHLFADNKLSAMRARKRFYSEISQLAQQLGLKGDVVLSADEEDDDSLLADEMKKEQQLQQRGLENENEAVKTSTSLADRCIYSTIFKKHQDIEDEEACRLQQKSKQSKLTNRNFREYLREHKRRKITEPTLPEFETSDIRLRDVCARAQMGGNFKRMFAFGKTPGRKPKIMPTTLTATAPTPATFSNTTTSLTILATNVTTTTNTTTAITQPITLTSLPPPPLPPPKLSEPPALVPIQPMLKKPETYQMATKSPTKEYHLQQQQHHTITQQQQHSLVHTHSAGLNSNTTNDSLNISQLMSVTNHEDNLNLCMDDSSLLTADHDAFNMLDNEVELQQEEVETFGGTCEETIPAFVIGNDVIMPSASDNAGNDKTNNSLTFNKPQQQPSQQMETVVVTQPVPKLEPISRTSLITPKVTSTASTAPTVSELIQETHACYFSLIRDFFCSTPNHRMRYDDLRHKIDVWLRNPITALNEWYSLADNWSNLLKSAINFLVGEFPDLPDEYVPYIEHKVQLNIYQWIGAGRDSDNRLTELCTLWMEKRKQPSDRQTNNLTQTELKLEICPRSSVENDDSGEAGSDNGGGLTPPPPPPRCPTNWAVRAATLEEIAEFQRQERERFEQPHKAYTYRMYGYESVVGPVKGIYTPLLALSKARGHSMMVGDRPNFVTILTLVRDATARLPNGEGTRAEISELLKCSQYINRDASENVLQTIVSGALDRMHTEHDPCVRYDPKRKIWIYLHRNRSEEEFERIHQENQTIGKTKKLPQRKPKPLSHTSAPGGTGKPSTMLDNDNFNLVNSSETSNVSSKVTGSLITMPALVPSNPIIVSNNSVVQRQQQVLQQQLINSNKCPPVPPLKYNIPLASSANSTQQQQQQKSLLKTTIRTDNKALNTSNNNSSSSNSSSNILKQHSFQMPPNKNHPNHNTTPIIVATPQGLQTVHVSNATSVMPAQNTNNQTSQQLTNTAQQQQQQQHNTNLTANLAGKRVTLNKPIIINQVTTSSTSSSPSTNSSPANTIKKSPQQLIQKTQLIQNRITLQTNQHQILTQQQQQSNLIIPLSMANNMSLNVQSTSNVTEPSHPPTTSQTVASNPASASLSNKQNIIRLVPTSNVKTLMSAQSPTTQIVNRQRIVSTPTTERPTTPQHQQQQQQKSHSNTSGFQLLSNTGNVITVSGTVTNPAGSIVKMSPQQFAALQQKQGQQQQHIIVKHSGVTKTQTAVATGTKPQRVILGNTSIVGQTGQGKSIVLQQIPVASSSVVVTPSQATTVSSATTTISGNKIQTINAKNLTPQQQRILIQNLKKQQQQQQQTINPNQIQFKTVQVVGNTSANQTNMTGRVQTVAQHNNPKTSVVVVSQDNATVQQQNITRILKTTSPQLKSDITGAGTRVITSSSGQIISLDNLIQKQGGTLRITGTANNTQTIKTNQQHLTANVLQKSQQQQVKQTQQYAIVSVPNSIISLGSNSNFTVGQRIITTQAGSSNTSTLVNLDSTKVTPSVVSTGTGRVITATAAGTKIITKQTPATSNAAGNIRLINTVNQTANINLATLQGKQVVLTTGKTLNTISKTQSQQQQNVVQTQQGSIVIGGQTVKLQQGNTNIQQLLQKSGGSIITSQNSSTNLTATTTTPHLQTVIMGNQILRVQQLPQIVSTANRINVSNAKTLSNNMDNSLTTTNSKTPKTIFVGSTGQTLRLQPASSQTQNITNKNIIVQTQQQNPTNKTAATSSGNATTPNRVVLAVQGGGQIFLSPNFQGGNINLKSLQNMKVVSLAQHPTAKLKDSSTATNTSSSSLASSSSASTLTAQPTQNILKTTSTPSTSDTNV
ncbi:nuclear factor related to kappa-B-binding protein [Lucilia sericata]|uniref:nuclear factor related to kappa-B-binding protein n=1 Tax=Lucilia sericata TaxID=13632 RepID=UPI0018A811C4|nr:nuclear factor related to kappa-B-binding protein [Lucilia sericata]